MKVILEIDGVRHKLVEASRKKPMYLSVKTDCKCCSLYTLCKTLKVLHAPCGDTDKGDYFKLVKQLKHKEIRNK